MNQNTNHKFSDRERNLFKSIADHVQANPNYYKEAGEWLDEYCSESTYWLRQDNKLEELKKKHAQFPVLAHQKTIENLKNRIKERRTPALLNRFQEARNYLLDKYGDENFVSKEIAAKVIIITWLLTDPDAEKRKVGITELETWPWEPIDDVSKMTRSYAGFLFAQNKDAWMRLVCIGWDGIATSGTEAAPKDKGESIETDQGSLQKIIEILKNWQKSEKTHNDFEAAKLALPPIAKTYDILCRSRGQCGAKTTNIIKWLGSAANDGTGYYPALLEDFASAEVIADLESWQANPAGTEQEKQDMKSELVNANKPTATTRFEGYLVWFKENKVISILLVLAIIIIAFGSFTDALQKIRDFWFKPNSSVKQEMNISPTSDKDLSNPIVVASATVEVKITSDWDFDGTVANAKAYLAFVKNDKPLLITSKRGYTASQTGNDEVVYKAKLDMDAKDTAVGNPTSFLKSAEYIQIEFGRMPPESFVLEGDVICIINNSVRLEFSIPPQKLVNNRIFIRNLSESLRVLNEPGN